jgi:hypothetical protein
LHSEIGGENWGTKHGLGEAKLIGCRWQV